MISNTPTPPYYAVIFTSILSKDTEGYIEMADYLDELVKAQLGYLGHESARDEIGITVYYWDSLESIANWRKNLEHKTAQKFGKEKWYQKYKLRISKVERDYQS